MLVVNLSSDAIDLLMLMIDQYNIHKRNGTWNEAFPQFANQYLVNEPTFGIRYARTWVDVARARDSWWWTELYFHDSEAELYWSLKYVNNKF